MISYFGLARESEKIKKRGMLGRKMAEEALDEFEKSAIKAVKKSEK